jgi:hypothetical protein
LKRTPVGSLSHPWRFMLDCCPFNLIETDDALRHNLFQQQLV